MSLISIIIPVYNAEKYIARCLESIINQKNCPPIEIVIIDDGSTDQTPTIISSYSKQYECISVFTQENQKQSAARNNGLRHIKGEYIMFIDSDDYLDNGMLSVMYEKMETEHTDLCICGIKKIFIDRKEIETISCLKGSQDLIADYLAKHQEMDVGLWNKLFKRSIIDENHLRFENGNFFEDTLFVFKYLCNIKHGVSFIESPLYNLVKREESTTTSYSPEMEYYAKKLTQKIISYLQEKHLQQYMNQVSLLECRSLIHIIHHQIKYNYKNAYEEITKLLTHIKFSLIFRLPVKYSTAIVILKLSPSLYIKIYRRNKADSCLHPELEID